MFQRVTIVGLLLLSHLIPGVSWAVTPAGMQADIEARYKITTLDALGFLHESGTVLVVRKEGLRADRPGAFNRATVIRDREVAEVGGSKISLGGNLDGRLKVGDPLQLYGIRVDDRFVELNLSTVKTFVVAGSRAPTRLQAIIRFQYDQGLAAITGRQVMGDIDAWFGTENALRAAKVVQQGQTTEEVIAILGEPEKKVLLGAKAVFVYSDMKLVFRDGRLVDME
ncbi:MAG: hypothetical protein HXX11_04395 [Desulfuromonadales bacterium]|nr:hypothetical protein [Desulfuromonadales bacterium]